MKKLILFIFSLSNLLAFSTTNIQILYGSFNDNSYVYDTKNGGKTTFTLEHYSTFKYGDVFMFTDYNIADDKFKYHTDKTDIYGEISPRLSLSEILSQNIKFLFVKDIYLATQYNRGKDYIAYLYGIGSDLSVPFFDVFGLNIYKKNQNIGKNNYQLSLNYKSRKFYNVFYIDGFTDWTEYDFLSQNQLLFDTKKIFKIENIYIGTEWNYYTQKPLQLNFNTQVKSNTFQWILKYVF